MFTNHNMNILQSDIDEMKRVEEKVVAETINANILKAFSNWEYKDILKTVLRGQAYPCRCMIIPSDFKTPKERIEDIIDKLEDEEQQ